ncbi:unnamed protein product, partial [marine sediment metagenome]
MSEPPSDVLERCLRDLEERIDPAADEANLAAWVDFLEDRCPSDIFLPPGRP